MEENKNIILEKTFDFSIKIIDFSEILHNSYKFVFAQQILKSGTSVGANVREAQQAESNADFIHKMKIALKEVAEVEYWLLLCKQSDKYPDPDDKIVLLLHEIKKIISKIIISSKRKVT